MKLTKSYQGIKSSFFLAATIEGRSKHTLSLYEYVLSSFERYLKPMSPLEAKTGDIRRYLLNLSSLKRSKSTIATHHKELKVFYRFLIAEGILQTSPMVGIKKPRLPRSYPYVLSEEDALKLLRASKGRTFESKRNYSMLLFFLDTGIRVSELCSLVLEDVNLATLTAKVNQGKGSNDRVVHYSKETARALSAYLRARGVNPYEDCFFVSKATGFNRLTRSGVFQMIKKLGIEAEVDKRKRVSPHTLRHTCATFWIKNGGDPVSLQRQLGQSDPRMVDVYVNLVGKDLKEAHSKYSPLKRLF